MASTSLTLSAHWESFIKSEVASGRYASASDVVRAALRELDDKNKRLEALRAHLACGAAEAARGAGSRCNCGMDARELGRDADGSRHRRGAPAP